VGVDATGIWGEGVCAIHGEICPSAIELIPLRGGVMEGQKSADGIVVSIALGTKARTCRNEEGLKSHRTKETQEG